MFLFQFTRRLTHMHDGHDHAKRYPVLDSRARRVLGWKILGTLLLSWGVSNGESLGQRPAGASTGRRQKHRVDEVDRTARRRVAQAREFLQIGRTEDAINIYRRLIDEQGSKLIQFSGEATRISSEYTRYVTLRDLCHMRICSLDPDQLSLYQRRVDPLAKELYQSGCDNLDARSLQRVVDDYFASSYGDDALVALGELALERGEYSRARQYWEQVDSTLRTPAGFPIIPVLHGSESWQDQPDVIVRWLNSAPPVRSWLVHPNTNVDVAAVRARLALVSIRERSFVRAKKELSLLQMMSPSSQGMIDGQVVDFAEELATILGDSTSENVPPPEEAVRTFSGRSSREGIVATEIDIVPQPVWTRELGLPPSCDRLTVEDGSYSQRRYGSELSRGLPYFPVGVGNVVLAHNGNHVWAFEISSGDAAFSGRNERPTDRAYGQINTRPFVSTTPNEVAIESWWVPCFTMTAVGDSVFVRMGNPFFETAEVGRRETTQDRGSFLVGLDLNKQGKLLGNLIHEPDDGSRFEGTPISDGRFLYVAHRRNNSVASQFTVSAFDPKTGLERWRQWVISAGMLQKGKIRGVANNLLSLSEGTLFVNTNLGGVAAMDADSGTILWLTAYPRLLLGNGDDPPVQVHRDPNPCLVYKDLIIVAPHDCDQLFALDRMTGQLVWKTGVPRDLAHVLGVVNDHLVVSGDSFWWLNVYNGTARRHFPPQGSVESLRSGPAPRGLGRGLITERSVWWPTEEGIYVFDVQSMQHIDTIRLIAENAKVEIGGGNLLIVGDHLLVTTAKHIHAFNRYGPTRD